ncbi:helix-turn-helix transcriptional regulator [Chitinophaga arvensicola]|uniref:AraC-type DNA-binding protein n=1 Tax=Chitinophaga arvensicola TaxID=29529 RepID=A0A1I0S6W1_9BACT|nr:helix-turn-helix transcriptional regulator [Chitinophaga arvensicola]SEW51084.1 AraC-type DNA-binding protein [Chitinophaga arvensicola]
MIREKTYYELEVEKIAARYGLPEYQYIQVRQSKAFMEKCYAEKIELTQIAQAACMSRFHFIRLFQSVYGVTPRQYLRDVRIHKAMELFRKGIPVARVCYEVGYQSTSTFSGVFKRGTGLSPKEYLAQQNSNPE